MYYTASGQQNIKICTFTSDVLNILLALGNKFEVRPPENEAGVKPVRTCTSLWQEMRLFLTGICSCYKCCVTACPEIHLTTKYRPTSIFPTHLNVLHPAWMNDDLSSFNTFHSLCF